MTCTVYEGSGNSDSHYQAPGPQRAGIALMRFPNGDSDIQEHDKESGKTRAKNDMADTTPIRGLFETHLTVSDLGRSVAFYRDIVGLPLALELPERGAAFFWIGAPGQAMLGLWSLGSAPMGMTLHIAFTVELPDVLAAASRLRDQGIMPLSFFGAETAEPSVIGWMPAAAVYFRDPDGHLLEYLAMLDTAPRPDLGIVGWSEWLAAQG
jgi:lactoylglutathione lyase